MRSDSGWVRWRPSPAMAVSLVALFVALSGTALALQRNSVGARALKADAVRGKHIKNGQVKSHELRNGAVKHVDLSSSARSRWAEVRRDGTLVRGRGVTASARTSLGHYEVAFDRNVRDCSATVSPSNTARAFLGAVSLGFDGGGHAVDNKARVRFITSTSEVDVAFYMQVLC